MVPRFLAINCPVLVHRISVGKNLKTMQITYDDFSKVDIRVGKIVEVVNFPPKQIGPFSSECLTLGVPDSEGKVVLVSPTLNVPAGGKLF